MKFIIIVKYYFMLILKKKGFIKIKNIKNYFLFIINVIVLGGCFIDKFINNFMGLLMLLVL